ARELERIAVDDRLVLDPHLREAPDRLRTLLLPAQPAADLGQQRLLDDAPAAEDRVQHRERVLEDQPDLLPADRPPLALLEAEQVAPAVENLALRVQRRREEPRERGGGHRLAAAGLADRK